MTNTVQKWLVNDINDFIEIVELILNITKENFSKNEGATVVALYGDLGAGKTTFTKQLAKHLKIQETITSPTYIIKKSFQIPESESNPNNIFNKLIHIDTYRIDLEDELIKLGWSEDILYKNKIIAVEWPENIEDILPKNTIRLHFKFIDEVTREVELK
jgi:tRNA threonylcarbamoyladenosine biosynthesis protein TsaE